MNRKETQAEINNQLDQLSKAIADLNELKNKYSNDPDFQLKNHKTGKIVDKEFVFNIAEESIRLIKLTLEELTTD